MEALKVLTETNNNSHAQKANRGRMKICIAPVRFAQPHRCDKKSHLSHRCGVVRKKLHPPHRCDVRNCKRTGAMEGAR